MNLVRNGCKYNLLDYLKEVKFSNIEKNIFFFVKKLNLENYKSKLFLIWEV